jgi:phage shock protein A
VSRQSPEPQGPCQRFSFRRPHSSATIAEIVPRHVPARFSISIFQRFSDILSANLADLADKYEDPEKMLKQAIREMETSIEKATQETAKTLANEKLLAKELAHNEGEMRRWQGQAERSVKSGDDELARKALTRKKEHEKLAVALREQLTAISEAGQTLRNQLDGMKAKLAEAKRNLATLTARQKAASVRQKALLANEASKNIGLNDQAFKKFDRLREKVEMAEAEAEALAELRSGEGGADMLDFPASSSHHDDIEAELERLKGKQA